MSGLCEKSWNQLGKLPSWTSSSDVMATQRATAKAIGVDHSTINKDLKPVTDVTNEAPDSHETPDSPRTVTNVTPPPVLTQSGAEVAKKAESWDSIIWKIARDA